MSYQPYWTDPLCIYRIHAHQGIKDLKPDVFYFNFAGYSGKIIFTPDQIPIIFPYQNLKIEPNYNSYPMSTNLIDSWRITTEDGIVFIFSEDDAEMTNFRYGGAYYTTWYLSNITSNNTSEIIEFIYNSNGYQWEETLGYQPKSTKLNLKTASHENLCNVFPDLPEEETEYTNTKRLSRIDFSLDTISIYFQYANDREDIGNNSSQQRLDTVLVINNSSDTLKAFSLENDWYFTGSSGDNYPSNSTYQNKRLKLKSLKDNILNVEYTFDYYEDYQMPSYISDDTDHWGYYNAANNSSLIPALDPDKLILYTPNSWTTADKETDTAATKACILEKITYPTGGYTEFEWEPHYYSKENETILKGFNPSTTCYADPSFSMTGISKTIADTINEKYFDAGFVPVNISVKEFGVITSATALPDIQKSTGGEGETHAYVYKIPGSENWDTIPSFDYHDLPPFIPYPYGEWDGYDPYGNYTPISTGSIYLEKGVYLLVTLKSEDSENPNNYITASLQYSYNYNEPYFSRYAGGLRIKTITSYDGISHNNDIIKNYIYRKDFLEPLPSGAPPSWYPSSLVLFDDPYNDNTDYDFIDPCDDRLVMTSYHVSDHGEPILSDGYHVGYGEVTEITNGNINNGAIIYKYKNDLNPKHRDLITDEIYIDPDTNIVKHINYEYTDNEWYFSYPSIYEKTIKLETANHPCEWCNIAYSFYDPAPESNITDWLGLKSKIEIEYFPNGDSIVNTTEYQYFGAENKVHTSPNVETKYESDGSVTEIYKIYSGDMFFQSCIDSSYSDIEDLISCQLNKLGIADSNVEAILKMQQRNMLITPMEVTTIKKTSPQDTSYQVIDSKLNIFKYDDCIVNPQKSIYVTGFPDINTFSMAYLLEDASLQKDSLYNSGGKSITFIYEDENLVQYEIEDNYPVSFLWGYHNLLPVAKAVGVTYNTLRSIVPDSPAFQNLTGDNLLSALDTLRTSELTKYAEITTYTYDDKFRNITSIKDVNGLKTTFEYDDSGRLVRVRDHEQNLLREYDYHYASDNP